MSLRAKIFICFVVSLSLAGGLLAIWSKNRIREGYSQSLEDLMVDSSSLIATILEEQPDGPARVRLLENVFGRFPKKELNAEISGIVKRFPSLDLYLTDAKGIVLFSSLHPEDAGRSFDQWNDVYKTLQGQYGARATRVDPKDPKTSVYYVAAPIAPRGRIEGVVTLIKHRTSIAIMVDGAVNELLRFGLLAGGIAIAFGLGLFLWITRPINQLRHYAFEVAAGRRAVLPQLREREMRELLHSLESMRTALDGRKNIERFSQQLAHELKSPLTAIKGSAELAMEEDMSTDQREKFLSSIGRESDRAHEILARILRIAELESMTSLTGSSEVNLRSICDEAIGSLLGVWKKKDIQIQATYPRDREPILLGDPFLLSQAVRNLLENAIDFSPKGGSISLEVVSRGLGWNVEVKDHGPGIPDFAKKRIFEKFFSLERPEGGRKGTGLGLVFVKEVAELHGGEVNIESSSDEISRGTRATLIFPSASI